MKAHIARNQNAGVPLALGWNLSAADRGILEGMAPAFGMKLLPVSPADAGKTVAQLLGVHLSFPTTSSVFCDCILRLCAFIEVVHV